MAGPQNGIVGNDYGIDIPETNYDKEKLLERRELESMAKFSRTAEYARQKAWAEKKIRHYQQYLPNGQDISTLDPETRDAYWVAANEIIKTLREFLSSYESATEQLKKLEG